MDRTDGGGVPLPTPGSPGRAARPARPSSSSRPSAAVTFSNHDDALTDGVWLFRPLPLAEKSSHPVRFRARGATEARVTEGDLGDIMAGHLDTITTARPARRI